VALGLRAHSGWAALVAVGGTRGDITVLDRRRLELGDPEVAGPKQPYHEAEGQPLPRARRIVDGYAEDARRRAVQSLGQAVAELQDRGFEPSACALLTSAGRPLPDLAAILASHALIHAADGALFREGLAQAAGEVGLTLVAIAERDLSSRAQKVLGRSASEIARRIGQAGRALGPPWTQDQKLAALAAWVAVASAEFVDLGPGERTGGPLGRMRPRRPG
jgi:hypothetical protein